MAKAMRLAGRPFRDIADEFGVSRMSVWRALMGVFNRDYASKEEF
ncbi:hypothetical protein HYS54_01560 [Candidatus Micrarchaeota archaeon]|nr:hypothetical protein [Candidatus Micrarchaeota archaeon]